jgi:outer membrane protein TolC
VAAASLLAAVSNGSAFAQEPAAPSGAEVLTLQDAVALALRNNRSVSVAAMEVERAEWKIGAAKTRALPNFEVEALAPTRWSKRRVRFPATSTRPWRSR